MYRRKGQSRFTLLFYILSIIFYVIVLVISIIALFLPIAQSGIQGPQGFNGTNGYNGTDGANGVNGTNGQNANINVTIINESNNTNVTEIIYNTTEFNLIVNISGNSTFICTPGPPGIDGRNGTDGINGTNGIDGRNGTDGINGTNGTNGTNGIDGRNGTDGINGTNGTNGTNGINGTNGTNGINGTNGTCNCASLNGTLFSVDSTMQTVGTANILVNVTFNKDISLIGWSHTLSTPAFTATKSATYLFYTYVLCGATGGSANFLTLIKINNIQIDGSAVAVNIQSTSNTQQLWNAFKLSVSIGDVLLMQIASTRVTGFISAMNLAGLANNVYSAKILATEISS